MSIEFREVVITKAYVPSTPGTAIPVQLPSDIIAGDLIIIGGGGVFLNVADSPPGFSGIGSTFPWVRWADGSEAGTTVNLISRDTTNLDPFATSPNPREAVFAAFSYRGFTTDPIITGGGLGPSSAFHPLTTRFVPSGSSTQTGTPKQYSLDYAPQPFGGFVNTPRQFRWLSCNASAFSAPSGGVSVPMNYINWYGDLIQDRTGLQQQPASSDPDSLQQWASWSWADQIDLTSAANNDPHTDVIADGGAEVGFSLTGFALLFPGLPVAYWGINASTPF
jgi:hypothetical protein